MASPLLSRWYLLLIALTLALALTPAGAQEPSSVHVLVEAAAELNRRVPPTLGGYRARLESEISIGNRRAEGMEMAVSLEQVASELTWDRTGAYAQRIIGYRTQALGANVATIGFFRSGWIIPSLYGNRLALLFGRDTTEAGRRRQQRQGRDPLYAVHPLATDRARYYTFSGGDTVQILRTATREVPIVRVTVALRPDVPAGSVVFVGDLDLDASRGALVRLRGSFAVVQTDPPMPGILRAARPEGIAYVEAVNAEIDGTFWLPAYQRFEVQATTAMIGESRAVLRIVTKVVDRTITTAPAGVTVGAADDTLSVRPFRLIVEAPDSLDAFRAWTGPLGALSTETRVEDFDDVAPDRRRPDGPPRATIETERFSDVARFNRIEGLFVGIGGVMRFRDAAPGVTLRAAGGYAMGEHTMRGRVVAERRRAALQWSLRLQRSLDLTNDFRNPFDSGTTLGAVFGRDPYDYVDRQTATVQWLRFLGERRGGQLRIETGVARDRAVTPSVDQGLFGDDFLPNRAATSGSYRRTMLTLDLRPDISLEYLRPGLGARLHYERGDGELTYQRAEVRLTARANPGPFIVASRLDVGMSSPDAPPQQFFELGQNQNLPGYGYKQFAGDQAAVWRSWLSYSLPVWRAPIYVSERLWFPPVAPALALGVQAGWTRASTATAAATVTQLGSEVTGDPRASASLTLRMFGGAVGVGVARPIGQAGKLRVVLEFGQRP
ncbi:MAG: hypothetical protein FJ361_07385 [Gemmatimonadetes bacterium]|nr:hypothetical protein [Gemmatimonadota bacterium]